MPPVIRVENLSKLYRIGTRGTHADDLRHRLGSALTYPFRKLLGRNVKASSSLPTANCQLPTAPSSPLTTDNGQRTTDDLWALRDVSFEVQQGEILGIIGRNGAGKSTLLKILSRITEPTTGRIEINGRIGALLEVGTGFHADLTGRENVYLNGMILGMTKAEIDRHFDAIVDFSGVAKFIDTPVKRYSSGMHVRLGFAVAAHLEPEILIVDEVLAVGDAEFQRRCLGKLGDVAKSGRTVLVVSHNMAVVNRLCSRAMLMCHGRSDFEGSAESTIRYYLQFDSNLSLVNPMVRNEDGTLALHSPQIIDEDGQETQRLLSGQKATIRLTIESDCEIPDVVVSIGIDDSLGGRVGLLANVLTDSPMNLRKGITLADCRVQNLPLTPGRYSFSVKISSAQRVHIWAPNCSIMHVEAGDFFGEGRVIQEAWMGTTLIAHHWTEG